MGRKADVDAIAEQLAWWARFARKMPPAWRGGGISHPLKGPQGQHIGSVLPGEGLYLDCDLKYLGVRRRIPHVVERTPMRRLHDMLRSEAAAITSMAGIRAAYAAGKAQTIMLPIVHALAWGANEWGMSYQQQDVNLNSLTYPANPGSALDQTNFGVPGTTGIGSMNPTMIAPGGSDTLYIVGFGVNCLVGGGGTPNGNGAYMLVDILYAAGNLPGSVTTTTTISSTALTRYTSGAGVLMTLESTSGTGTQQSGNFTVVYTNQAGTTGQSTGLVKCALTGGPGTCLNTDASAGATVSLPFCELASGDFGVRAFTSITFDTISGTNTLALSLYYPLCFVAGSACGDDYQEFDLTTQVHGIIPMQTSSGKLGCLGVMALNVTSVNNVPDQVRMLIKTVTG